jgi:hypothetical protein
MMKHSIFMKLKFGLVFLALAAGAISANAQPDSVHVHVGVRPPPARIEHAPPPRAGHVWAPGYWGWNGGAHVWIGGHWEAERPGFRFVEARWALVGSEWVFYPAFWDPLPAPVVMVQSAAPIVVQQAPTVYIEQQQQAAPSPAQLDPNFWYYCHNPAGYYPYVKDCATGWQKVTPTPMGDGHP